MSTISLEQTRAQSAHSYLQSENLTDQRVKVKTRAEQTSLPAVEEHVTKGGFFSRFSRKKEAAPHASEEETREKRNLGAWFKKMNRKSAGFLAQILGADKSAKKGGPPMKWDHFAKVGKAPVLYVVESESGLDCVLLGGLTGDDRHGFRSGCEHCGVECAVPTSRSNIAIDFIP
jgi:hypothetical protein